MALKDALIEEQPFTIAEGTPTLTIKTETGQRMLAWSNYRYADWMAQDKIEIHFHGWRVDIQGRALEELWTALQQQNVQTLRTSTNTEGGDCFIQSLSISVV